jgi:hypothetical protein
MYSPTSSPTDEIQGLTNAHVGRLRRADASQRFGRSRARSGFLLMYRRTVAYDYLAQGKSFKTPRPDVIASVVVLVIAAYTRRQRPMSRFCPVKPNFARKSRMSPFSSQVQCFQICVLRVCNRESRVQVSSHVAPAIFHSRSSILDSTSAVAR